MFAYKCQNPSQLPAHLELDGAQRESNMNDGVSRSACLSEASCAEGSDHSYCSGQLVWAALSFLCFVSFLGRPRKEMKFPNGIHWKKKNMGGMIMNSYSIYGTNEPVSSAIENYKASAEGGPTPLNSWLQTLRPVLCAPPQWCRKLYLPYFPLNHLAIFSHILAPTGPDFSGWNWRPSTLPFPQIAGTLTP